MSAGTPAIEVVRRVGIGHRLHACMPAKRHGRARDWRNATILVSAGGRGLQLELAPADLIRLAGASPAHITRDH